jgi:outer membrane protein OmpA-like peptidoglycan-associated protein
MMRRNIVLAAALLALPLAAAEAQPVTGWYVAPAVGINGLLQQKGTGSVGVKTSPNVGVAVTGSVGYGFGNGLRIELEGDFRYNNANLALGSKSGSGNGFSIYQYGPMVNAYYDFDIGVPYVYPYIGAGVGAMWENASANNNSATSSAQAAFQGVIGAAWPVAPHWAITTDVRALVAAGNVEFDHVKVNNAVNIAGMLGLRYTFYTPPPPPMPAPMATPAPAPARTYLVFFDWDKADLTDRARQIIADAAQASTHVNTTQIEVDGHADLSGSPQYNQGLSLRRAKAVGAELVKDGVPQNLIFVQAFGDTRPLVPTARGVREPQNRRVEIILK